MPDDKHINLHRFKRMHCIHQGLIFLGRRVREVYVYRFGAGSLSSNLKGVSCPCGGLKEEIGNRHIPQDFSFLKVAFFIYKIISNIEYFFNLIFGKAF